MSDSDMNFYKENADDSLFVIKGKKYDLEESGLQKTHLTNEHNSFFKKAEGIQHKGVNFLAEESPYVQYKFPSLRPKDNSRRGYCSNLNSEPLTPIFKSKDETQVSVDQMSFQSIDESMDSSQLRCPNLKNALNMSPTESPGPIFSAKSRLQHSDRHSCRTTSTPCNTASASRIKARLKEAFDGNVSFELSRRSLFSRCSEDVSEMDIDPYEEEVDECKEVEKETSSTGLSWKEGMSNLIGDMSAPFRLPLYPSKHQDLKAISPDTMAEVLRGKFDKIVEKCIVVDCRYPYEYEGGHIMGAINICSRENLLKELFGHPPPDVVDRPVIIFHCEFSSERAPKMMRFLRNYDRDTNQDFYPTLCYPELYLLEGGYKAFFLIYSTLCDPSGYRPMDHPKFVEEFRIMHSKSKTEKDEIAKTTFRQKVYQNNPGPKAV